MSAAQQPMAQRVAEMIAKLTKFPSGVRVQNIDQKVLKQLIKKGKVKLVNRGTGGATHRYALLVDPLPCPTQCTPNTPYAKRIADQQEAGLVLRGRNRGKTRVDLPREARELKISKKREMWAKLSDTKEPARWEVWSPTHKKID
jgi:hypothetical protein